MESRNLNAVMGAPQYMADSTDTEWREVSPEDLAYERMERRLRAQRRPTAQTVADLKEHMFELISVNFASDEPAAVCLAELNRRFGSCAVRLGTTAREIALSLMQSRRISLESWRKSTVAYDKEAMDAYLVPYQAARDLDVIGKVRTLILDRALRK